MATWLYQVLNTGVNNSIQMSNTMYLSGFSNQVLTTAELNAGITRITAFYTAHASFLTSTCFWTAGTRVLELDMEDPSAPPVIKGTTAGTTVAGTGGVQTINQAAICIAWRTAIAGRSYRGRTFMGVLAATAVAGGTMSGGLTGSVIAAGNNLITTLAALATPLHLVVYSRKVPACPPITSCYTDAVPDVLRSRKR